MSRKIIIIAGPNGAGKTTFARSFLPAEAHCPRFINAGRLMLQEIDLCVTRGDSFAFETTLSGLSYLRHIDDWKVHSWALYDSSTDEPALIEWAEQT
jgi:predicted ABC-type ATPase